MEIIVKDSEGKEHVCTTTKEATKLARKIERKEKKQEEIDKTKRELAYVYAESAIARILYAVDTHKAWTFESNHHDVKSYEWGDSVRYETVQGRVETEHRGYNISGFLWDHSGFDVAVRALDKDTNTPIWWAIGIYDGRIAFKEIPFSLHAKLDPWLSLV